MLLEHNHHKKDGEPGIQYDCMTLSKVKVKVTSPWKSEIRPFSKAISSPIYNGGGVGKWPRILKLGHNTYSLSRPDFLFLSPFLCHVTLKLAVSRSRPPVPYGANLLCYIVWLLFKYFSVRKTLRMAETLRAHLPNAYSCCPYMDIVPRDTGCSYQRLMR